MTSRPPSPSRDIASAIACFTWLFSSGLPSPVLHILEHLRHRLEHVADFAHRLAGVDDFRQHLQRGDKSVAGRREIGKHDMARLLAADIEAMLAHMLDDITVADLGARQRQILPAEEALEARDWT